MIGPDDLSELIPGDPYLRKRMAASNKEERQIWIKRTPDLGSPQIWDRSRGWGAGQTTAVCPCAIQGGEVMEETVEIGVGGEVGTQGACGCARHDRQTHPHKYHGGGGRGDRGMDGAPDRGPTAFFLGAAGPE